MSFTGDIYLYMLILSTDRVGTLHTVIKTLFEQSERLVKISAAVFDKDENLLEETGLMVTSKYSGLYAIDGDGNLKSLVGVGGDGVKIKGDNITLEGLVTANDNFKILKTVVLRRATPRFTVQCMPMRVKSAVLRLIPDGCTGKPVIISAMIPAV